jgi:hypothetical protein
MGYLSVDFGQRKIRLLETDGSVKKLKIKGFRMVDISREEGELLDDPSSTKVAADIVKKTLAKNKFSRDPSSMAIDSSACVVRDISLPFKGDDQIRKVIKFETEGHIQYDIDDVVVDYFKKTETIDKSNLMVIAARKDEVQKHLDFLDRANVDPVYVDLDILCLFNALSGTKYLTEHKCFIVINVSSEKTDLLVIDKGRMVTCRSIPLGAGNTAAALQHELNEEQLGAHDSGIRLLGLTEAESFTVSAFSGDETDPGAEEEEGESEKDTESAGGDTENAGGDTESVGGDTENVGGDTENVGGDAESGGGDTESGGGDTENAGHAGQNALVAGGNRPVNGASDQIKGMVLKRGQDFLEKFRREVVRMMAFLEMNSEPEKVYLTGEGCRMPGLKESVEALFHSESGELDFLSRVEHSFSDKEVSAVNHEVGIALGAAYKQMGHDATRVNLRQEEIKYAKKFDQIKAPIAGLTFLLLIMMILLNLELYRERQCKMVDMKYIYQYSLRELGMALGDNTAADRRISSKASNSREGITLIQRLLVQKNNELLDELGRGGTIPELPSAFPVWHAVMEALLQNDNKLDIFKLDSIKIVTLPNPTVTLDGEVGSGKDMSTLLNILKEIPMLQEVTAGDDSPTPTGNRKFTNIKASIDFTREGR